MEKLLELLSESTNGRFKSEQDLRLCIEMRGYCRDFIKWLVENDKIDLENLQCVFSGNINKWKTLMEETDGYERYEGTEYEATESLIMLLSISDTPIEFLCEILR